MRTSHTLDQQGGGRIYQLCTFPTRPTRKEAGRYINYALCIMHYAICTFPRLSTSKEVGGDIKTYCLFFLLRITGLNHGVEAFHMQGIHYGRSHHKLIQYTTPFLNDLAGNAFHAWGCAASFFTGVQHLKAHQTNLLNTVVLNPNACGGGVRAAVACTI